MMEKSEHLKNAMPTERKSTWRTVEERRMSDLTRVLEWLERRKGKKKQMYDLQVWTVPAKLQAAKLKAIPTGERLTLTPRKQKAGGALSKGVN